MGVYIKGLRKPPKCEACVYFQPWVNDRSDDSFCPIAIKETRANDCPSWCPITEVKPHGRLIDIDDIDSIVVDIRVTNQTGITVRLAAPTIIESEGEE